MGFALKIAGTPKAEIDKRVREAAKILGLTEYLDRKPKALSGGQRQRVAMGRAIVRKPKVFLMDEPLSNLDAKLRVQTRTQIASLQRSLGVTTATSPTTRPRPSPWVTASRSSRTACSSRSAPARDVRPPRQRVRRPASSARRP